MVTTDQYMNRNLALVVKSWGFRDILNALTSSADTEFPVVESEGNAIPCVVSYNTAACSAPGS